MQYVSCSLCGADDFEYYAVRAVKGFPGGIKVRCKKTNRYYVFVDGKAVGQLCPTERIGVSRGKHVVEIYDPVTDTRREFDVDVVDTRLSVRIRVD